MPGEEGTVGSAQDETGTLARTESDAEALDRRVSEAGVTDRFNRFLSSWLARLGGAFRGREAKAQDELIASLYEVASAVSTKLAVDEILGTVVDEAKRLVHTDKAVLVLMDEDAEEPRMDRDSIVVRGSRSEYQESWWYGKLEGIAETAFASGKPRLTLDRANRAWVLCVPISIKSRPIGLLAAINSFSKAFTDEQVSLLAILGAFAGSSIESARLVSHSKSSMLAEERSRISKEMHDGLAQQLFSISLGMEVCKRRITSDPDEAQSRLGDLQQLLSESLTELRRYIYDLRPISLERLGLTGALQFQIAELSDGGGPRGRIVVFGNERPLEPGSEACLFRVAQEAIANVAKHSRATYLRVALRYEASAVELTVEDNGRGFELEQVTKRAERGESMGILSMRQRVEAEGGTLQIASRRHSGTTVRVWVPC
jgi:signal transduction histidine kinase